MEAAAGPAIPALCSAATGRVGDDDRPFIVLTETKPVTAPPFFPSAGRGTTNFWGKKQGPTVFLWESLDEGGREECEKAIRTHKDWVVWSRARPAKGDCKLRGFEQEGKAVFQGKVKRKKKEHETARTEDETENDAPDDEVEGGLQAERMVEAWGRGSQVEHS